MGIRGLTTYIAKHSDQFLEPYELHNCTLVIDGNSLASMLYNWHSKCVSGFGGEYDKYANCVSNFFVSLQKACISPIVIFDGGYETKKINTVMLRLKRKIILAKHVTPTSRSKFFPLLMKEVFKDVLRQLSIPFAQCYFEGDDEIAAIARCLGCPVLSYDSDFYIYNVLYIPFSTLNIDVQTKQDDTSDNLPIHYIECSIYKIDNLLMRFGGLSKPLIPLMAILLGNDYIKRGIFRNFFANLKICKTASSNSTQKKIASLLAWLQNETLETALEKVLLTLKKPHRDNVREKIMLNTTSYVQCSSDLLPFLGILPDTNMKAEPQVFIKPDHVLVTSNTDNIYISSDDDGESGDDIRLFSDTDSCNEESEEEEDPLNRNFITEESQYIKTVDNLPCWLKDSFRKGNLPSYFIDMVTRQTYFSSPQVEDYNLPYSHTLSLPIIGAIYGILMNGDTEIPLVYYSRNTHSSPEKQTLNACDNEVFCTYPSLVQLATLTRVEQESLLLKTLGISIEDSEIICRFPLDCQLFIVALICWARNCKYPAISNCHIHSLLICVVVLHVIDGKIGYLRTIKELTRALGKQNRNTHKETTSEGAVTSLDSMSDFIQAVTRGDCIRVAEVLLPFHNVHDRLKGQAKFYSITTVHAFAQFQSILFHTMHLNALLHFPLQQCKPANFFSGTFVYNMYTNLKRRVDVMSYINLILTCGPTISSLYNVISKSTLLLFPNLIVLPRRKKKPRDNKRREREEAPSKCENEHLLLADDETYTDISNKFFSLSTCDE